MAVTKDKYGFSFFPIEGTEIVSDTISGVRVSLQKGRFGSYYWCYTIETVDTESDARLEATGTVRTYTEQTHRNKTAASEFLKKHGITLSDVVTVWPFYRAVVTMVDHLLTEKQLEDNDENCYGIRTWDEYMTDVNKVHDHLCRGDIAGKKFGF